MMLLGLVIVSESTMACIQHQHQKEVFRPYKAEGTASWYGPGFDGRKTASGERFNRRAFTAAHKSLPLGTRVKVYNTHTKKSIIVKINDRGPYAAGRLIDLSEGAAKAIGLQGVGHV